MPVTPAALHPSEPDDGSEPFVPAGDPRSALIEAFEYVEEEWIATGEEDGRPYVTTVFVRRPRDPARFSGTVFVEPLHLHSVAPVWMYSSPYFLRSGHGWACVASQKLPLDLHVKGSNPGRYAALHIDGPESSGFDIAPPIGDAGATETFWAELDRRGRASNAILAEVGAALRAAEGPYGSKVAHTLLGGHSQTGSVTTYYIVEAHGSERLADGSPVFDGFFPSGYPTTAFAGCDVPIVQVLSEGDVSNPTESFTRGYGDRAYRRDDSDDPSDRYRLYEIAGIAHMGTRCPPYDNVQLWQEIHPGQGVPPGTRMNSLPHNELFNMTLHHLVEWVATGVAPPRADRLEVDPDGYFAKDKHGNTRGGVRCVQLDVPRATYFANPFKPDGTPSFFTLGGEQPLDEVTLKELYRDRSDYVERFNRRLNELVRAGWFLEEDADDLRNEAEAAELP